VDRATLSGAAAHCPERGDSASSRPLRSRRIPAAFPHLSTELGRCLEQGADSDRRGWTRSGRQGRAGGVAVPINVRPAAGRRRVARRSKRRRTGLLGVPALSADASTSPPPLPRSPRSSPCSCQQVKTGRPIWTR
jgi:hypothetical protein